MNQNAFNRNVELEKKKELQHFFLNILTEYITSCSNCLPFALFVYKLLNCVSKLLSWWTRKYFCF